MKLNPEKCVFGVPAGQLLGFLVSAQGIEANPEKIAAIDNMRQPRNVKDIQKFTGCLATLSRFISRLREKALPLYHLLKKTKRFVWSDAADAAFIELKRAMVTTPEIGRASCRERVYVLV